MKYLLQVYEPETYRWMTVRLDGSLKFGGSNAWCCSSWDEAMTLLESFPGYKARAIVKNDHYLFSRRLIVEIVENVEDGASVLPGVVLLDSSK